MGESSLDRGRPLSTASWSTFPDRTWPLSGNKVLTHDFLPVLCRFDISGLDESIYRDVYMPSRKVFDASMFHHLRSDRPIRRPRGKRSSYGRGQLHNTVSIRPRPVEADDREVPGHLLAWQPNDLWPPPPPGWMLTQPPTASQDPSTD
jgi:hypothetical protein